MVFVDSWAIAVNSGFVCCSAVCFTSNLMSFSSVVFKSSSNLRKRLCDESFSSDLFSFIRHRLFCEERLLAFCGLFHLLSGFLNTASKKDDGLQVVGVRNQ